MVLDVGCEARDRLEMDVRWGEEIERKTNHPFGRPAWSVVSSLC